MSDRIPQHALEFFADTTGLSVRYTTKDGITGGDKVRIPMADNMRLVCPTQIVASRFFEKVGKAAIVLHVRHDLYLMIVYDTNDRSAGMFAFDGSKVSNKCETLLQRKPLPSIMSKVRKAIVRSWVMRRGSTWQHIGANCMV